MIGSLNGSRAEKSFSTYHQQYKAWQTLWVLSLRIFHKSLTVPGTRTPWKLQQLYNGTVRNPVVALTRYCALLQIEGMVHTQYQSMEYMFDNAWPYYLVLCRLLCYGSVYQKEQNRFLSPKFALFALARIDFQMKPWYHLASFVLYDVIAQFAVIHVHIDEWMLNSQCQTIL